MRAALLLLSMTLLAAAAPAPSVPLYRSFGRWLVACDNTRACEARGFDEVTRADLRLLRPAGDAPATLMLSADGSIDRTALRLDGAPVDLAGSSWKSGGEQDGATLSTSDPRAVAAFVAAARNAHLLQLDAAAAAGDDPPRVVPLDGFTAALLLVDAVQGRPGTPGALIAPTGTGTPPAAVPLPSAPRWVQPPPLTEAETRTLVAQARQLRSPSFDDCNMSEPPEVAALDAKHAIAIRPCYLAAYQSSSVVAILPRGGGQPVPLRLAMPGLPRDATQGPDVVEPSFDPATGQLVTSAKGRGLADCGVSASWTWSAGAFRLTSLAFQDQCGGAAPGDWPTLFRTAGHP